MLKISFQQALAMDEARNQAAKFHEASIRSNQLGDGQFREPKRQGYFSWF
jgi:hypothetical protein